MTEADAARLLVGAVDLHVHPAPSPYPRRLGPVSAAGLAGEAGMRAVALKCHHHCTATDLAALAFEGLGQGGAEAIGGIVLNNGVGGINPHAVNLCFEYGGRIVWLPTTGSPAHIAHVEHGQAKFPSAAGKLLPEAPIDVWDASGERLTAAVGQVLDLIAEADGVLASGHLPASSIVAVFREARERGVRRLLVNHPNFIVELSRAEVRELVDLGAYVEHATCMYDGASRFKAFDLPELVEWIRAVGIERSTLASDLGQADNPLPAASLTAILGALRAEGFTDRELRALVADNPARVVGLDP
jgi:hypothetical protein